MGSPYITWLRGRAALDPAFAMRQDSITNPLSQLGNAAVDKGAAGVPLLGKALTLPECRALYRNNGIAKRWIDILPDKATKRGWRVDIPAEAEETEPDLDPMSDFDDEHDVWGKVADAWRWARRDGGAYIFLVTDRGQQPEDLREALDGATERIVALHVFTCDDFKPAEYDDDLESETYREPRSYYFNPAIGGNGGIVHASRVLYFAGALLDPVERHHNNGIDDSIFQASWDQIRHLTTIGQAGANLAQELQLHVVKTKIPHTSDALDRGDLFDARWRMLAKQKASVGVVVLDDDEDYYTVSANISGFKEFTSAARGELAAVTGLPEVELFGDTPGGLNTDGESGRVKTNDLVAVVQSRFLHTPLRKLYGYELEHPEGPVGGTVPERWGVDFHPAEEMTDTERAALEKTHAETDVLRINSGVLLPEHVTKARFGPGGYQHEIGAVEIEDFESEALAEMERLQAEVEAAQNPSSTEQPSAPPQPEDDEEPGA